MYPRITVLPYYKNVALDIFTSFAHKPWSMLLHSGNSNHINSRFDIIVAEPITTIVTCNGLTKIDKSGKTYFSKDDPFSLVDQELKAINIKINSNNELPFQGGAVGCFGYDLARYIEDLPILSKKDIFLPEMAIGLYLWTIISDHKLNKLTLISYDNPKFILSLLNNIDISPVNNSFKLKGPWNINMTRKQYSQKFNFIKDNILNGNCYQVCLSQRFHALYSGNIWLAFHYLLSLNKTPFSAFINLDSQMVCSFSPERFLSLNNMNITTQPIKGTISRLDKTNNDINQINILSNSIKNKAENLMIVDLLRNDISKVALPGSIRVSKLFNIETFPTLHHMVSTIKGILDKQYSACDLLRACFPSGSVTGAPKISAMKIIEQLEPYRRNVWCGSIGYISYCGNMDTNIAIRTLLVTNDSIFCSAGSGIIADSEEEIEFQEIIIKLSSILPPLNNLHI